LTRLAQKKILDFIKRLKDEIGLGAVMVTHIITDVFGVADKVAVLYGGEIIYCGAPEKMSEIQHPFITSFLANAEV